MKLFCTPIQGCGQECTPKRYDYSFAHEFGIEINYQILSDCCEARIVDDFGRDISEEELKSTLEEF